MYRIAFWHAGVLIDGESVEKIPLGGTESALIYMARALASLGNEVTVYTCTASSHRSHGVSYKPLDWAERELRESPADVFISLRQLLPAIAVPARARIYFSPDAYDQPFVNRAFMIQIDQEGVRFEGGMYSLGFMQRIYDSIYCVGGWQATTFADRFSIPREKLFVAGNGVDVDLFHSNPKIENRNRSIVYASTPFRGLDHLLRLFPAIKKNVPDAKCEIFSGMQLYGQSNEADKSEYGWLYERAKQDGVTLHGPVAKPALANALSKCRVMAYPNTFAETFCIAALEAQACGLPVVTTDLGGLAERVDDGHNGHLIQGRPGDADYDKFFVEHVSALLLDDSVWQKMSDAAFETSRCWDYTSVAKRWIEHFNSMNLKSKEFATPNLAVKDEEACLLVNGYSKKVEFSSRLINSVIAENLSAMGFASAAKKFLER